MLAIIGIQRHTIDLNQGAQSPSAVPGASITPEEQPMNQQKTHLLMEMEMKQQVLTEMKVRTEMATTETAERTDWT